MKKKITLAIIILFICMLACAAGGAYVVLTSSNDNLFYYNPLFYGFIGLFVVILIVILNLFKSFGDDRYVKTLETRLGLWNSISYKVKGAGENVFDEYPIAVMVLDNEYKIMWSNKAAKDITNNFLQDKSLKDVANQKLLDFVVEGEKSLDEVDYKGEVELFERNFSVVFSKKYRILYLEEITDIVKLKTKFNNQLMAVGYLNIDNLEEVLSEFDVQGRSEYQGKIISEIVTWAENNGAYIKALVNNKYIIITDREHLIKMQMTNFPILDDIKVILKRTKAVNITISMGIVCDDLPAEQLFDKAQEELDLALNRGGDQAVVVVDNHKYFYGAKTDPIVKENKVRIRDKYLELESLIKQSNRVFCIGHRDQDADSFGSCIAMYNFARSLNKEALIVFDENSIDETVARVYQEVKNFHKTLFGNLINPEDALKKRDKNDLLIVVDCQAYEKILFTKDQVALFDKIAVIDHHRKNEDETLNNCNFFQLEAGASCCIEVIFQMLQFTSRTMVISSSEATWMLLGMVVDTNNFTYRTSASTFEVAAILNKYQANTANVRNYLKEPLKEKRIRSEFVNNYEIYGKEKNIAIAVQSSDQPLEGPVLAKISDEILTVKGVELVITVAHADNPGSNQKAIRMSARSLGRYNCQTIMEALGGGGHLNGAACRIPNNKIKAYYPIKECVKMLKSVIDEIMTNDLSSKVSKIILLDDFKNLGSKGELVSCSQSEAFTLIDLEKALPATPENILKYEEEKNEATEEVQREIRTKIEIKHQLEAQPIIVKVRLSDNGDILDEVSAKTVSDAVKNQLGIDIERKSVSIDGNPRHLGSYDAVINLDNDIFAYVKIHILEKVK